MLKTIQEIQKLKNIGCRLVLQKRLADIITSTKSAAPTSCSVKKATPIAVFLSRKHETLASVDMLGSDLLVILNTHYRRRLEESDCEERRKRVQQQSNR